MQGIILDPHFEIFMKFGFKGYQVMIMFIQKNLQIELRNYALYLHDKIIDAILNLIIFMHSFLI